MSDERIREALRAVAEDAVEIPEGLETRVLKAYRRRSARKLWWRTVAAVAAAAALVGVLIWPRQTPTPVPAVAVVEQSKPVEVVSVPAEKPVQKRPAVRKVPREMVTDFFPLVDVAPPFERGELIRVNLSKAALRTVGLPVAESRLSEVVQADVLISEEGQPRAIRFVNFQR